MACIASCYYPMHRRRSRQAKGPHSPLSTVADINDLKDEAQCTRSVHGMTLLASCNERDGASRRVFGRQMKAERRLDLSIGAADGLLRVHLAMSLGKSDDGTRGLHFTILMSKQRRGAAAADVHACIQVPYRLLAVLSAMQGISNCTFGTAVYIVANYLVVNK
ncbi:hypothetical protein DM02DRAFT_279933 [Periconia macrospinosa]|uniref:Uncharacterized protein n=1 Tax=Periconia macrospinosa TaxID=97972 RepID=A0A2V1DXU1_9PLEO|nr:hypothetical protein DM02DRAFT_279933 [Periconia macrospinosa]